MNLLFVFFTILIIIASVVGIYFITKKHKGVIIKEVSGDKECPTLEKIQALVVNKTDTELKDINLSSILPEECLHLSFSYSYNDNKYIPFSFTKKEVSDHVDIHLDFTN